MSSAHSSRVYKSVMSCVVVVVVVVVNNELCTVTIAVNVRAESLTEWWQHIHLPYLLVPVDDICTCSV